MVCHWPEAHSLVVSSTLNKMDAIWQYAGIWAWSIGPSPNIIKIDLSVSIWRTYPTAWSISLLFGFILWSPHFTTQISEKYRITTICRGFWSLDKYSSSSFSFSNWNDDILSWRFPKPFKSSSLSLSSHHYNLQLLLFDYEGNSSHRSSMQYCVLLSVLVRKRRLRNGLIRLKN